MTMAEDSALETLPLVKDTKRLADEAAKDLQTVLASAGVSDDVLRNVVQKVQQRGRGGRSPAGDPRLDPNIEPKKAKRILANRLSAAKSKMRQRVLSESLEILKAKENSRHASVERSDGPPTVDSDMLSPVQMEELHSVKRTCAVLEGRTRDLEVRLQVLEAQLAIAASTSLNNTSSSSPPALPPSTGIRILSPSSFSTDTASLLAALTAAGRASAAAAAGNTITTPVTVTGGSPQAGGTMLASPGMPPLVTSAPIGQGGGLAGLFNLSQGAAFPSNISCSIPLQARDPGGCLEAGGGQGWVLDASSMAQLMSLQGVTLLQGGRGVSLSAADHAGLRPCGSGGPPDHSKDEGRGAAARM